MKWHDLHSSHHGLDHHRNHPHHFHHKLNCLWSPARGAATCGHVYSKRQSHLIEFSTFCPKSSPYALLFQQILIYAAYNICSFYSDNDSFIHIYREDFGAKSWKFYKGSNFYQVQNTYQVCMFVITCSVSPVFFPGTGDARDGDAFSQAKLQVSSYRDSVTRNNTQMSHETLLQVTHDSTICTQD